jgi:putative ABC transport system permease protein
MFRNYIRTAFRSLSINKVYSFITVAGLGVGIAVCLVIFLFIRYEHSFDDFHRNSKDIYRILTVATRGENKDNPGAAVPFPLPTALKQDFPDWKTAGIFSIGNMQVMSMGKDGQQEKKFKEKGGIFMLDPGFFSIFDYTWLAGTPETSLRDPHNVVLSRSAAERYFGNWKQAVGRTIKTENRNLYKVSGILADPPFNTDLQLKIIFPYTAGHFSENKDWVSISSDHGCYVLLPPNENVANAQRRLTQFAKKYRAADNFNTQLLQPLSAVHFDARAGNFSGRTITRDRIYSLWTIAAFILLIACVNFINISTAQAVNRSREVGVRKVLGGRRPQLTLQFMLEAFFLVAVGVLFALLLTSLVMAPMGRILNMPMPLSILTQSPVLLFLIATTVLVTLLAGLYPAFVLSSFKPITALKTKMAGRSTSGINMRRGLVVAQFVIAQALIIGTLLMVRQMDYFTHTAMGFTKGTLATVSFPRDSVSMSKLGYLRNQLHAIKGVQNVSFNSSTPADDDNWYTGFTFDHAAQHTPFAAISKFVDDSYVPTYGLQVVAGRNINATDSINQFLVNETLVKKLGFSSPQDVVNKEIDLWNGWAVGTIVGVVKDFHQSSMKDSLQPVFMLNRRQRFNAAAIRIDGRNLGGSMHAIEKLWSATYPNYVFEYQFLDEKIASFYKEEAQLSLFYKVFASIAIFLSCLGLYGLASFMAVQRLKEVGIRKVLGATALNIVYLFSREFVLLIGIAFLISTPIAWYFIHQWVQQYVFRLPVSAWVFAVGGLLALLIAMATLSFQALKTAAVNPVKSLRSE